MNIAFAWGNARNRPALPPTAPRQSRGAFTLIEMLVVILIIAILAALLLPTLSAAKAKGQNIKCLSNLKQMTIAWVSYTSDNTDKLAQNVASDSGHYATTGTDAEAQPGQPWASWVLGDADSSDVTLITHGLIYPYQGNWQVDKCPTDIRLTTAGPTIGTPALRSYSMNAWMNGIPSWGDNISPPPPAQINFKKLTEIVAMSTANAIVFIEENPKTINDGYWAQNLCQPTIWVDSPAHYHVNGGAMTFADGHASMRTWTDKQVLGDATNPQNQAWNGFPDDPTSPDLPYVQAHVTVMQ